MYQNTVAMLYTISRFSVINSSSFFVVILFWADRTELLASLSHLPVSRSTKKKYKTFDMQKKKQCLVLRSDPFRAGPIKMRSQLLSVELDHVPRRIVINQEFIIIVLHLLLDDTCPPSVVLISVHHRSFLKSYAQMILRWNQPYESLFHCFGERS